MSLFVFFFATGLTAIVKTYPNFRRVKMWKYKFGFRNAGIWGLKEICRNSLFENVYTVWKWPKKKDLQQKTVFLLFVQHQDQCHQPTQIHFQLVTLQSDPSLPLLSILSLLVSSRTSIRAGRKGSELPADLPLKKPFFFLLVPTVFSLLCYGKISRTYKFELWTE